MVRLNVYALPVSQRCDYKPVCTPQELILVYEVHISNRYYALVSVFLEVEPSLLQPFEVSWVSNMHTAL